MLWRPGTRLLGINVTQVARWVGPAALTLWAIAWLISHGDTETALPKDVSPLELNDALTQQIKDPSTKIGDLPAGEALRALAVVMASTRDEERSAEILRFGRALRRHWTDRRGESAEFHRALPRA
ncbi:hypothetical protein [Janibacter terrae]|uniref:hypothetical protein n=1 Tax=Janibacter terrae TaxID=103817 RepID=UPI0031F96C16